MLPLQQAREVTQSIREYIRATFAFNNEAVENAFYSFIEDPARGMIKGPYVSLRTPFVAADPGMEIPLEIQPNFRPHLHQMEAFKRLTCRDGHQPQPTLLTTGTGSGKTEAFEFPIFDYCWEHRHQRGIKVIILYPMNALATDQAKRLAADIWNDPRLKGVVRAGLFIGKEQKNMHLPQTMGPENIIEDQDTIAEATPDILLTNFKMLDIGLMQNKYADLWKYNVADPTLLKFIVLDELHTYDGAQGTDVANLLRRLKLRLNMPQGHLCPVGTSATLGNGEDAKERLCRYASDIFGEKIATDAVIGEHRLMAKELFTEETVDQLPTVSASRKMGIREHEDYESYIENQKKYWRISAKTPLELGERLNEIAIVRTLVEIFENKGFMNVKRLMDILAEKNDDYAALPEKEGNLSPRMIVLESLLALIAEARRPVIGSSLTMPYLFLQVQLWVRELSGIRRVVSDTPEFTWRDDKSAYDKDRVFLPAWYCRECGASGWYMLKNEHDEKFVSGESETVQAIAVHNKRIYLIYPVTEGNIAEDYRNNAGYERIWIDPASLAISMDPAPGFIECHAARMIEIQNNKDTWMNVCPECNDPSESVTMIGTQTATLGSLSVGQLLSSNLENAPQRKILAFTNGVQDASHDASFFEARNFRFMFRTATQKVVGLYEESVSLAELGTRFVNYWKREEPGYYVEKYVTTFYPTDLEGRFPLFGQEINDRFIAEFDLRMTWQITQEYGYGAFIGRTLEKTGSSATFFKEEELREAYRKMIPWLTENRRENITEEKFIRFLNLVLHRMRLRGGIDHPFLQAYREDPGWYKLNRPDGHWQNRTFGKKQRWPLMTVTHPREESLRNALDSTYRRSDRSPINWYHSFYKHNFTGEEAVVEEYFNVINNFYIRLFEVLEEIGIVTAARGKTGANYAINPEHIFISQKVKHIRCGECRSQIRVAKEDELSMGACCMGHQCQGRYTVEEPIRLSYYHNVYHRNHVPRVFAHEHNGMLDRKKREEIEKSFIKQNKPNSINTLVATSTLEMGIDIGDLNCGINISVPPTVANFTQRIGRAGRKTGASLIVNYAKRDKPHDLFYFAEPQEMMNGDVGTPNCFLEAKEILARHFYAFCIDSWGAEDERNSIPSNMIRIPIGGNFVSDPNFFINQLHKWISDNFAVLRIRFSSQYEGETITEVILQKLFNSFTDTYFNNVKKAFERINKVYHGIKADIANINEEIASRHLAKTDPEYKELAGQIKLLRQRYEGIETMNVLEFMTDSGLLPNYAFPETGVRLTATVCVDNDNAANKVKDDEFELVRPASQGIKELAPGNIFFARRYRLIVDGLVTTDWSDTDAVSEKRFCSECDYLDEEKPDHPNICPKCGSQTFGAASNVHKFVKLEAVSSWMHRKDAMADDRKDDRDSNQYKMSNHFRFQEANAVSYAMTEIPFGIQFVKNVELTDVNLGDMWVMTAQNLDINGRENVQRHGFIVCRHCGKAVKDPLVVRHEGNANKRMRMWHYPYCRHKTTEYEDRSDDVFEEVYLYRNFQTEAIKVLLPVGEIDTQAQVAMFKAGLMLGMRDYFGGEPSHIKMRDYREMNMTTGKWDNYLVIYDAIPGGSGYLEKLNDVRNFTKILKLAYERIRDCECQHSGKDGCYHCILTYANQFEQKNLSREKAEELFKRIVDKSGKWETVNGSLGGINTSGGIEESELEERFIRTLKRYVESRGGKFEVNSEYGYRIYHLTIGERRFIVQPQYTLDSSKGVKFYTIADFLITEPGSSNKPFAIYLDGYRYHGASIDGAIPRFFHDVEQRNSIIASNRFIPWTLTWEDLDLADTTSGKNHNPNDSLYRVGNDQTKRLVKQFYGRNSKLAECLNSFERMMFALLNTEKLSEEVATMLVEYNHDLKISMHSGAEMVAYLTSDTPAYRFTTPPTKNDFFFTTTAPKQASWLRTLIAVPSKSLNETRYVITTDSISNDLEKEVWNHYWRLQNLLGLLGWDSMYSEDSLTIAPQTETRAKTTLSDLLDAYDNEDLTEMITLLYNNDVKISSEGYFVLEENGAIVADALLGSEQYKFAVTDDPASISALASRGYAILDINEIEKLKNIITK